MSTEQKTNRTRSKKPETDPIKLDFRNFLFLVWKHLNLPDPTPIQYDIALYLQHGPRRRIIEAFRGVGKSWITSAFVCWLLYCNPQLKILVVSASKERADAFSTFTLRLISEIDFLKHLTPDGSGRSSMISFDVAPAKPDHSPSVKSVGITGQITGSRADYIVADDVEVPNNSQTQMMRDKLSESVKEFDAIIKPGGNIIYLGTPQTELSLYNKLPERGYEIRIWPAEYPSKPQAYANRLAPIISSMLEKDVNCMGRPTDPLRFSRDDLLERKASYGAAGYALQFMLDTSLSDVDKYPLKLRDLIVTDLDLDSVSTKIIWSNDASLAINDLPCVGLTGDRYYRPLFMEQQFTPYTGCVMAIDPSGRGKDETAYAVIKIALSKLFLVDFGGFQGGYDDNVLMALALIAKKNKVNHIIVEANFGDGMFTKLLTPHVVKEHKCLIEEVKHSKQKELRIIDTLEPIISNHKLVVDRKLVQKDYNSVDSRSTDTAHQYRLMYQLTRITRDRGSLRNDDRLDALAMAVAYWTEQMSRDEDKARNDFKSKALENALSNFKSHVFNKNSPKQSVWFSI